MTRRQRFTLLAAILGSGVATILRLQAHTEKDVTGVGSPRTFYCARVRARIRSSRPSAG